MKKQLLLTLLGSISLTAFAIVPPVPKWGNPDTLPIIRWDPEHTIPMFFLRTNRFMFM